MFARLGLLVWALALLIPLSAGCSRSDQPELGQVEGIVTLNEQPLADAQVLFIPESGRGSSAVTDAEGRFKLQYTDSIQGALVGSHSVQITTAGGAADGGSAKERLPATYHQKTTLTATVKGGPNRLDFKLSSP